jgi:hypothetical protein
VTYNGQISVGRLRVICVPCCRVRQLNGSETDEEVMQSAVWEGGRFVPLLVLLTLIEFVPMYHTLSSTEYCISNVMELTEFF